MKSFILLLAVLLALPAFSALPVLRLDMKSVDEETGKGLPGTTVEVFSEGNLVASGVSDVNGDFERIDLPISQVYLIYFKTEGYVTKVAEINGHCSRPMDLPKSTMVLMRVTMFKKAADVDLSFMEDTPIIKYKFDSKGWMTFDRKYTEGMIKKINGIRGIEE